MRLLKIAVVPAVELAKARDTECARLFSARVFVEQSSRDIWATADDYASWIKSMGNACVDAVPTYFASRTDLPRADEQDHAVKGVLVTVFRRAGEVMGASRW